MSLFQHSICFVVLQIITLFDTMSQLCLETGVLWVGATCLFFSPGRCIQHKHAGSLGDGSPRFFWHVHPVWELLRKQRSSKHFNQKTSANIFTQRRTLTHRWRPGSWYYAPKHVLLFIYFIKQKNTPRNHLLMFQIHFENTAAEADLNLAAQYWHGQIKLMVPD